MSHKKYLEHYLLKTDFIKFCIKILVKFIEYGLMDI